MQLRTMKGTALNKRNFLVKTFFDLKMVCESGGYSPSGTKPKFVCEDWKSRGLIEVTSFQPIDRTDLELAHSKKYIEGVFAGTIANGHGNRNRAVADSTLWTVGSMVAAARQALVSKVACSPSSGFHHAHYESGGGFCTFNGLIVAARTVLNEGRAKRVGILDCDWHYGDGTENILRQLQLRSQILHRTSGREHFDDVADYDAWLTRSLEALWEEDVDLILYQAGADAHRNDPLGGLLSDQQMADRDRQVFDFCFAKQIPIAWNLAGGYQRSSDGAIDKVIELHRATMKACIEVFEDTAAESTPSPFAQVLPREESNAAKSRRA